MAKTIEHVGALNIYNDCLTAEGNSICALGATSFYCLQRTRNLHPVRELIVCLCEDKFAGQVSPVSSVSNN